MTASRVRSVTKLRDAAIRQVKTKATSDHIDEICDRLHHLIPKLDRILSHVSSYSVEIFLYSIETSDVSKSAEGIMEHRVVMPE